jgi:hypothetical protein
MMMCVGERQRVALTMAAATTTTTTTALFKFVMGDGRV